MPFDASHQVHLARQPIFDLRGGVAGYELLYRAGEAATVANLAATEAAGSLMASLIDIGLDRLSPTSPAFINMDRDMLLSRSLAAIPPNRVVVEILEGVVPDAEVLAAVSESRASGYRFALDDFVPGGPSDALLPFADFVKVDAVDVDPGHLERTANCVRRMSGAMLLAEKIESEEQKSEATALGYQLFQGYLYARPTTFKGKALSPAQLTVARLLGTLSDPNATVASAAACIQSDVALTFNFMRYVRSASAAVPARLQSVHDAIGFLGLSTVRAVATLSLLTSTSRPDRELLSTAVLRATMCGQLARDAGAGHVDSSFLTGLFTVLPDALGAPLDQILESLPLEEAVIGALSDSAADTVEAQALRCTLAYERGRFDHAAFASLDAAAISRAYLCGVDAAAQALMGIGNSSEQAA